MKVLARAYRYQPVLITTLTCLSLTACESINDPTSAKIATYDATATGRVQREDWLSGQKDKDYYEDWKKIYLNQGFSEKEARIRAADKHYFRYQTTPPSEKSDNEEK